MPTEQIVALICAVAPTLLAALFATKWWKEKTGATGRIIEAAAMAAVAAQNRERVNADRADPSSGRGVGSVSLAVAKTAKSNAVSDAAVAIAGALNPTAGELAGKLVPVISEAVERAVEAAKPKVPKAVENLFPDK